MAPVLERVLRGLEVMTEITSSWYIQTQPMDKPVVIEKEIGHISLQPAMTTISSSNVQLTHSGSYENAEKDEYGVKGLPI